MSIVWIVLYISRTPLSNNSRRRYATPDTGLSCKEHYPLCRATPGKLFCMNMHIYMHIYRAYYAICAVQFVLESVTIHWGMGDLSGTIHLNKTNSPSPSSYGLPITLLQEWDFVGLPCHTGIFSGLYFCRTRACFHSSSQLICITSLLCPENTVSLSCSTASGSYYTSTPLPQGSLSPGGGGMI